MNKCIYLWLWNSEMSLQANYHFVLSFGRGDTPTVVPNQEVEPPCQRVATRDLWGCEHVFLFRTPGNNPVFASAIQK